MSGTKLKDALKRWEERNGTKASEAEEIKLYGTNPPIERMDSSSLSSLGKCRMLSLSSNKIERIGNLSGLKSLETLSLGRNKIRRLENMDGVSGTLKQLWISYNQIDKLSGIEKLKNLEVLYMTNNSVEKWSEFDKLKDLNHLTDLAFHGNPIHEAFEGDEEKWRLAVLKKLQKLKVLDGESVLDSELEKARKFG